MPYSVLKADYVIDKSGYEERIIQPIDDLPERWRDNYFCYVPEKFHDGELDGIAKSFDQKILFVYEGVALPEPHRLDDKFIHQIAVFNIDKRDWDIYQVEDDGNGVVQEEQVELLPDDVREVWLMTKEMEMCQKWRSFLVNKKDQQESALDGYYENICRTDVGGTGSSKFYQCNLNESDTSYTFKINYYDYEGYG